MMELHLAQLWRSRWALKNRTARLFAFSLIGSLALSAVANAKGPTPIWDYPLPSYANQSCETRDYSQSLGPTRDQGGLSWCFAYTTADLISQRVGFLVSAPDIATTFILGKATKLRQLKNPLIRKYLKQHPTVFKEILASRKLEMGDYSTGNIMSERGLVDTGGSEEYAALLANLKDLCPEEDFPSLDKTVFGMMKDADIPKAFNHKSDGICSVTDADPDELSAIIGWASKDFAKLYSRNVDARCHRRPSPTPLIPIVKKYSENIAQFEAGVAAHKIDPLRARLDLMHTLDHALDLGRIASIGYSFYAISEPEPNTTDKYGDHASIIAARKMIDGQCRYLLRNSLGSNCDDVRPELERYCKDGAYWLTREQLSQTLFSVILLK